MIAARDFNALIFGVYINKTLCTVVCGIIDLLKFIYRKFLPNANVFTANSITAVFQNYY